MTHQLQPGLLRKPVRVLVVGCGGNGSAIAAGLPYLHQAMLVNGHPYGLEVTIMDGDTVSPTNCVRQPFSQAEIGHFKAVVLVSRMNLFWGLDWKAIPQNLTEASKLDRPDIVIGCVDTRAARRIIYSKVTGHQANTSYYLDLGNHATGGQFVLGEDGQPSCSAVEALERQEPFVNLTLAYHALALLAKLFRHGSTDYHGAFVNVAGSRVQPLPAEPKTWRALRRRGSRRNKPSPRSTTAG
jgi:hypothetical protein